MAKAARLRITLMYLDPAPWRVVEVPLSMSFKGLHDTIQAAFLWHHAHLWEFAFAGRRYGDPIEDFGGEPVYKAANARLTKLEGRVGESFFYTYDFGDDWRHRIDILEIFEAGDTPLPRFVDGAVRTPPEDVGGPPGFAYFLAAIADPKHEDHEHLTEWYGDPFDPADIERDIVEIAFSRLANARRRTR